ncbi:MAG: hypothetical protein CBD16_03095 [Betaproteobacteria bacterium TMED156]|nr:MAG: hypothetical protein CBD16_03095 [Betaproteobacteria bacterium TMED156]
MENFWGSIIVCVLATIIAGWWGWKLDGQSGMLQALWIFIILLILEISLSFDNAVVNASILRNWNKLWQMFFLTIGILIAVFGMRLVFPLLIVGLTTSMSLIETWNLAIQEPAKYSEILLNHHAQISAFGGVFLLLIFLDFFINTKKKNFWVEVLETNLEKLGGFKGITIFITLTLLLLVSVTSDLPSEKKTDVILFGIWGVLSYLSISILCQALESKGAGAVDAIKKGSIGGFIYLEVLDASFSIDAVVGAFAITKDVVIIMLGLGGGAMAVRSITIYLVKKDTLNELIYLEHGAHYAIGALAIIMISSVQIHIPEIITGTIGLILVLLSGYSSVKHKRKK